MNNQNNILTQLAAGYAEALAVMIEQVTVLRSYEITNVHGGDVRKYVMWRKSLPGYNCASRLYAEWQTLRSLYPDKPEPKNLFEHLVDFHGNNIDLWPPEIPDEIKNKAKAHQTANSLCPSFDDLSVRNKMLNRLSGLPQ